MAKITKIQLRILEKLESGSLDGLPAEVFVKGFVRSYAKCVGLDESEALDKFSAAQLASGSMPSMPSMHVAQALVDTMSPPSSLFTARPSKSVDAPVSEPVIEATPVIEAPVVEVAPPVIESVDAPVAVAAVAIEAPTKKKNRGKKRTTGASRSKKKGAKSELVAQAVVDAVTPSSDVASSDAASSDVTSNVASSAAASSDVTSNVASSDVASSDVASNHVVISKVEAANVKIDTAPVAKIDLASIASPSIEAKTDDAIVASDASIEIAADGAVEAPSLAEGSQRISQPAIAIQDMIDAESNDSTAASGASIDESAIGAAIESASGGTWQPTMPPLTTSSVPWRRPSLPRQGRNARTSVPTLLIDDADPDSADRERETRQDKEPARVSFLPPILLDREDRSARQGGLTLAVIILLIAATLTLSYLMRRPSPSGDGVTMLDTPSMLA